jgi:hypothetical protein
VSLLLVRTGNPFLNDKNVRLKAAKKPPKKPLKPGPAPVLATPRRNAALSGRPLRAESPHLRDVKRALTRLEDADFSLLIPAVRHGDVQPALIGHE